jgi:hypothetical protein
MVLFEAFADHAGALGVALVVLQSFAVHGGEDAAMDGLEAVAGVGQGAPDDDRHGISKVGAAHLLFNVHVDEVCTAGRSAAVERELGVLIVCHRVFSGSQKGGKTLPVKMGRIPRAVLLFYASEGYSARRVAWNKPLFTFNLRR